jgi:hypothetical protein
LDGEALNVRSRRQTGLTALRSKLDEVRTVLSDLVKRARGGIDEQA